ncbi:MAG: hypothetical protein ACD_22C00108G0002, partial [uncultured bacterium]
MKNNTNKLISFALLFVLSLTLTGCSIKNPISTLIKKQIDKVAEVPEKITGSFTDLINAGKSLKCTYESDMGGTKISGTTYVAGKKMRTDSTVNIDLGQGPQDMGSHMIMDGDYFYMWTEGSETGTKMKISSVEGYNSGDSTDSSIPDSFKSNTNEALNQIKENFDYNCMLWLADSSMFETPSDVTFTEFNLSNMGSFGLP